MKAPKTIVIAGASGVIGSAATEHFAAAGDWSVVALSRRTVNIPNVTSLAVDLLDREQSTAAMTSLRDVTHAVYAALFEKEGLIAGWTDPDQMRTNRTMFANFMAALLSSSPGLRHISLLQGAKAYGGHIHPVRVPARESSPRDPHENFYWLQEDHLDVSKYLAFSAVICFHRRADLHGGDGCEDRPGFGTLMSAMPG